MALDGRAVAPVAATITTMVSLSPGKPTLSEKLAATRTSFMNKSIDGAMGALSARPPGAARPSTSSGGSMRPPSGGRGGGPNMNAKPQALTCYLCGTQHFSQRWAGQLPVLSAHWLIISSPSLAASHLSLCPCSLFIHIAACQKKWVQVEGAKLPRERRALPPPPPEVTGQLPTDGPGMDQFNASMYAYWDRVSCMVCSICTRSFRYSQSTITRVLKVQSSKRQAAVACLKTHNPGSLF